MKYDVLQEAVTKKEEHKKKRAWHKVVTCMAAVVVFCTVYALILPAITLESKPTCGKEEHQHTGECYAFLEDAFQLVCGSTEHTHDDILCYIDNSADVEDAAVWEATLPSRLIGEYRHDLLKVAESQLDYQESVRNSIIDKEGYLKGYTRYGAWAEDAYGDWNAYFLAFCLHYAGIEEEAFPWSADYGQWIQMLTQKELFVKVGKHTAEAGDIVFLDMDGDGAADRAALVTELVTGEDGVQRLSVIEGDTGGTECYVGTEEDAGESSVIITVESTPAPDNTTVSGGDSTAGNSQSVSGGDNVSGGTVSNGDNTASGSASYADSIVPTPKPQVTAGYVAGGVATVSYESDGANIVGYGILPEQIFYCEKEAHLHEDDCYDENGTLLCELSEHVHIETCTNPGPLTEEEQAKVDKVIALIDAMPSVDEIYEKLSELYEAGDEEGEEAYMEEVIQQVCRAYQAYSKLSLWQKTFVTNEEKLLELEFIWSVHTLNEYDIKTVDAVDALGVTVKLFNYDANVNYESLANPQSGDGNAKWTNSAGFRFWAYQQSTQGTKDGPGAASDDRGYWPIHTLDNNLELMQNRLTDEGYPYLNATTIAESWYKDGQENWYVDYNISSKAGSLQYLFDVNGSYYVDTMTNGGGLFQQDEQGYYYYNSAYNAASYDENAKKFILYDHVIRPYYVGHSDGDSTINDITSGNFLPFTSIDSSTVQQVENGDTTQTNGANRLEIRQGAEHDMWFGMMIEMDFYMPADGQVNGEDMVFEFIGDDDVYVYVDNVLLLNLGGAHTAWKGVINFAEGTATGWDSDGNCVWSTTFEEAYDQANDPQIIDDTFVGYTEHTMKFFYMDRGANISYCDIRFNLVQPPENTLEVTKALDDAEVAEALQNDVIYPFRIVKADENGNPTDELYVPTGTEYYLAASSPYEEETGVKKVGANGIFYLRAGQTAYFEDMLEFDTDGSQYIVQELIPFEYHGQYKRLEYWIRSSSSEDTESGGSNSGDSEEDDSGGGETSNESITVAIGSTLNATGNISIDTSKFSNYTSGGSYIFTATFESDNTFWGSIGTNTSGSWYTPDQMYGYSGESTWTAQFDNVDGGSIEVQIWGMDGSYVTLKNFTITKVETSSANIVSVASEETTTSTEVEIGSGTIDMGTTETIIGGKSYWVYSTQAVSPGYKQSFEFKNYVDTAKLGKLSINKVVDGATDNVSSDTVYKMQVKLGDALLETGTKYILYDVYGNIIYDGSNNYHTIAEEGIIPLKAGQTAVVEGILSGTTYEVSELVDGSYRVTYSGKIVQHEGEDAAAEREPEWSEAQNPSGTFAIHDHVYVTVTNTWYEQKAQILVTKTCIDNEADTTATFQFDVEEGSWDALNQRWTPNAKMAQQSITVTGEQAVTATFELGYSLDGATSGDFYYKVTEVVGTDDYAYDQSEYIIHIHVENTNNATVQEVWKDGVQITYDTSKGITFVNSLATTITISKDVPDTYVSDKFWFTAEVTDADGNTVALAENSKYTVDGNKIIFSLGDGGSQTLTGIPIGGIVTVTETQKDGYLPTAVVRYDFEAEDGTQYGDTIKVSTNSSASGSEYVEDFHNGSSSQPGTLTFRFDSPENCTAQFCFRYATEEERTLSVSVLNESQSVISSTSRTVGNTGGWTTWSWGEVIELEVQKGTNYIVIGNRDASGVSEAPPNLDCFYILLTGDGNTITATADGNAQIQFTNILIYQLPKTGGTGTTSYILGGLLIMSASIAMLLLLYKNKKAEKGG